MNLLISNMCQAGFIHKETSKLPYQHPFLFCHFLEEDFVRFVEDFNKIDFYNYKKLSYDESRVYLRRDVYNWDALNKILEIKTQNTPVIEFENGIQISYPHILSEEFDEKYKKRLERFLNLKDKNMTFLFRVRSFMDKTSVDRFYNANNFNKIILFDGNVSYASLYEENEKTKIYITYSEHHQLVEELKERRLI